MNILFATDFVCPYCIVAKEALYQALAELHLEAEIQIQPYELTEEPKKQVDTFHDEVRKEHYQVLKAPAKELGLDIKLPPAIVPRPYTRLAFEGWHYAKEKGLGDQYADRMYQAYFLEEQDIGRLEILTKLAVEVGLPSEEFQEVLEKGTYQNIQKEAVGYAKETLQIRHVPTIYVDGEEVTFPTFQKEEWKHFLDEYQKQQDKETEAFSEKKQEEIFSCGIDGCK